DPRPASRSPRPHLCDFLAKNGPHLFGPFSTMPPRFARVLGGREGAVAFMHFFAHVEGDLAGTHCHQVAAALAVGAEYLPAAFQDSPTFEIVVHQSSGIPASFSQLLLAIKGLPSGQQPTITAIAQRLQIEHHTAIAIIAKLESRGLLHRQRDTNDRRVVLVSLTPRGERTLERLVLYSFNELRSEGPALVRSLTSVLR